MTERGRRVCVCVLNVAERKWIISLSGIWQKPFDVPCSAGTKAFLLVIKSIETGRPEWNIMLYPFRCLPCSSLDKYFGMKERNEHQLNHSVIITYWRLTQRRNATPRTEHTSHMGMAAAPWIEHTILMANVKRAHLLSMSSPHTYAPTPAYTYTLCIQSRTHCHYDTIFRYWKQQHSIWNSNFTWARARVGI